MSVVMPTFNEERYIRDTLESLLMLEEPEGGFEVLVVDGRSQDRTRDIIEEFANKDQRIRLIDNPDRITPCAFNRGIKAAKGDLIAIMGAHNTYDRSYLKQAQLVSRETGADNVGGSMFCVGKTFLQRAIAVSHHSAFAVGGARWHDTNYEGPADTLFGGVYRKEVFDRIGLFDESLVRNQDDELNLRLSRSGGRIWHSPAIRSSYAPRDTLGKLFRQYFQYGYWKVAVIKKHKLPASLRHLIPALFVGGLLSSILLAGLFYLSGFFGLGVLFAGLGAFAFTAWLVAALLFSLKAALASSWSYLPLFVPIFGCYHIGYGTGFLRGMVDFLLLGKTGRLSCINR
jgi:succinoglycan biosynthesis protein ExoA